MTAFAALFQSGRVQPLAVATFVNELLFQTGNLPVEKIVGLMNQADQGVGNDRRIDMV